MRQIALVMELCLGWTACSRDSSSRRSSSPLPPNLTQQTLNVQDSIDHIASQILLMSATRCMPEAQQGRRGCVAENVRGDSALAIFLDTSDHLVAASREWQVEGASAVMVADSLQARFTQAYGAGQECAARGQNRTTPIFLRRQWKTPRFTVQLIVTPSNQGNTMTRVFVAFVRGKLSCSFDDWYKYTQRAVRANLEKDRVVRWLPW